MIIFCVYVFFLYSKQNNPHTCKRELFIVSLNYSFESERVPVQYIIVFYTKNIILSGVKLYVIFFHKQTNNSNDNNTSDLLLCSQFL